MPPLTRGPLLARLTMLALPPGLLGPCLLCPFLLPLARSPRGGARRLALAMAGCALFPATSGPPTCAPVAERPATPADGLRLWRLLALLLRRRSRAARQRGSSLDSTSSPLGQARSRSLWATLGPSRFQCPREPLSKPGWGS